MGVDWTQLRSSAAGLPWVSHAAWSNGNFTGDIWRLNREAKTAGLPLSVISGPFHMVSPEGLVDFFQGVSGFLRAHMQVGGP